MSRLLVTVDMDWAPESAIEDTLDFLKSHNISPTVFITHRSPRVEASFHEIEVGLHPYFDPASSHGSTITEVVDHMMSLPHNIPAFRCHRFAHCNTSLQAMMEAGMLISSNVCTDLEIVLPFKNRFGLLEIPIFLEDGGYLWRKHPLEMHPGLEEKWLNDDLKVVLIHPMHFAINTPHFDYMYQIKQSMSRKAWATMSQKTINELKWKGRGIRDFMTELFQTASSTSSLKDLLVAQLR